MESSLKIAEFFVFFSIVGAIIFYLFTFGFSHLFDVVLGSEGLRVVLFRKIDIATISYRSIERAERRWIFLSPDASAPWSLVLPITNRTGLRGIIIKLKRRIGIFRYVAVTPGDPERFLEALRRHLPSSDGDSVGR